MSIFEKPLLGKFPKDVYISNSELQEFKKDKRQWFLGYYLGLKPISETFVGPLPLGTRIHNALEAYYIDGTHPVDAYERLQRVDNRLFLETEESQFEDVVKKFNKESELGRIMLEGYVEHIEETNLDAEIEVVGVEKMLSYRLNDFDPRVVLIGKIDLLVKRAFDGSIAVFDHKSCVSFLDYYKFAHLSEQLMTYSTLAKLSPDSDAKVDGGIYNLLKKVKRTGSATPPFYDRIDVRFNKPTLDSFWIRTLGTIRDIMATRDALDNGADHRSVCYPTPTMDWKTGNSPFFPIYSLMDDGSMVEQYIEDYYVQTNPNARYGDELNVEIK